MKSAKLESVIIKKIKELKQKRKAIILAHNYQPLEVQDIADFLGDSLELGRKASQTAAEVIVLCGVNFMPEIAAILCPEKIVLMPDINARCPMADMVDINRLKSVKEKNPNALIVAYVNTTAEVKAESDICCTSANAIKVIQSLDTNREIIFIPDKYLGHYLASQTAKKITYWDGYCPIHMMILPEEILRLKNEHTAADVIVHPECRPEVIKLADRVLSTGGMCKYAKEAKAKEIIVGTETGLIYRLQKENPDKQFFPASELAVCPNMKLGSLEKILWTLEDMVNVVKVPDEIGTKAINAINKMLSIVG